MCSGFSFLFLHIFSYPNNGSSDWKTSLFFSAYFNRKMSTVNDGDQWFREVNPSFWPGQAFSLEIDKILYQQKSKYQDVLVFKRYMISLRRILFNHTNSLLVKHMVMFLSWIIVFNVLNVMNVLIKKCLLFFHY